MSPTHALLAVGVAVATHLAGSNGPQRKPIPLSPPTDLRSLTVQELLARMPADPVERADHDWNLKPVPEELRRRIENHGHLLSDDEWRAALTVGDVIHMRPRWPANEPLGVWIHEPPWLRHTSIAVRAIEPDIGAVTADNLHPSWCANCGMVERGRQRQLSFGRLLANTTRLVLDVTIRQLDPSPADPSDVVDKTALLWHGQIVLTIESAVGLEPVLPASSNPPQESAVRTAIAAQWESNAAQELWVFVGFDYEHLPALRGVGISLNVELWDDDALVASGRLVAAQAWVSSKLGQRGACQLGFLPHKSKARPSNRKSRELRITGTSDRLLCAWEADCWWSGSFVMPLSEALRRSNSK